MAGGVDQRISDPLIGTRVNQFQIKLKLAEGGMGAVYVAEHERFSKMRKVIKVLLPEYASNPMVRRRFEREAEAASRLRHDNILSIDNFGTLDDGQLFLMVAFLDGKPLDVYLRERDGRLPEHRALHIAVQLCAALDHAHQAGVIHRDLKPGNVFIMPTDKNPYAVKLLDFGVAKVHGDAGDESFTHTGIGIGTPSYMAVEQYEHASEVTPAADIYSLAIVIWEMVTGDLPWGRHPGMSVYYHKQLTVLPRRPPSDLMSPAWCDILLPALRVDPASRPQTARELAAALASATPSGEGRPSGLKILADLAPSFIAAAPPGADTLRIPAEVDRVGPLLWPLRDTDPDAREAERGSQPVRGAPSSIVTSPDAPAATRDDAVTPRERPQLAAAPPSTLGVSSGMIAVRPSRGTRRTRLVVLGAIAGALAGLVTFVLATPGDDAAAPASAPPSAAPPASAPPSAAPPASAPPSAAPPAELRDHAAAAVGAVTPEPAHDAAAAVTSPGSAEPHDEAMDGVVVGAPPDAGVRGVAAPPPGPGSAAAPRPKLQPGAIVVKVKPWAEVWIDGLLVGQTPVRKVVSPGVHRVRLVGGDRTESFTVVVKPGQDAPVSKKWVIR